MGTLASKHEGKWPDLTKEELRAELPHGGVGGVKSVELSDDTKMTIAAAMNQDTLQKKETTPAWWDAFRSGSTYKPN